MAEFRSIQTRVWREDDWFQRLPTDARLFWIYLFSNPSASICGIYRLPVATMAFESGLPEERIRELLKQFADAGKAFYEDNTIWVVRMRENQLGRKISQQQLTGIDKDLAKVPASALKQRYLLHYGYPMDTVSIPTATDTGTVTVTGTVTDTDTDTGTIERADGKGRRPTRQASADLGRVCTACEKTLGQSLTPGTGDILWDWLSMESFSPDWICEAMKTALEAGKPTIKYTAGILRNWRAEGRFAKNGNGHAPPTPKVERFFVRVGNEDIFYRVENGQHVEEKRVPAGTA